MLLHEAHCLTCSLRYQLIHGCQWPMAPINTCKPCFPTRKCKMSPLRPRTVEPDTSVHYYQSSLSVTYNYSCMFTAILFRSSERIKELVSLWQVVVCLDFLRVLCCNKTCLHPFCLFGHEGQKGKKGYHLPHLPLTFKGFNILFLALGHL